LRARWAGPQPRVTGHSWRKGNAHLLSTAKRLGHAPAQIALAWLLGLAPNVLLIPGTSSVRHLEQNLAARDIKLDEHTRAQLTAATQ
jgi:pyridoxine 4-dehydrogenase